MSSADPAQPASAYLSPMLSRRTALVCAVVTIALLPVIFTDT
jgi:hypothetical protein